MSKKSVFRHLSDILKSIDDDLLLALRQHDKENRGGFFSISRQIFCYIDYLGALIKDGHNSTKNAISYMDKYFVRINPKYENQNNIMYRIWRHGTVHEYDPKVFRSIKMKFSLGWCENNTSKDENRKWHLGCFCVEKTPNLYVLNINLFEFVEDLKKTIGLLTEDLEFDQSFQIQVRKNLEKMTKQEELDGKSSSLLKDAKSIVDNPIGVIGEKGRVIHVFKTKEEIKNYKRNWKIKNK